MPTILRNPFRKQDENVRPPLAVTGAQPRVNGDAAAKPVDVHDKPAEYKLSEINDSGVYLPPSPTEKKSFWSTHSSRTSTSTSNHRSLLNDSEQFNISRESFDSYRRSFDISARSPVLQSFDSSSGRPRASLDSRSFAPPPPRSSSSFQRSSQLPAHTQEEREPLPLPPPTQQQPQAQQQQSSGGGGGADFEDVDIADKPLVPAQHKKRGLFARITDSGGDHHAGDRPGSQDGASMSKTGGVWNHLTGRKRGQSGQGAELGAMAPPKRETTPKPEGQLRVQQGQQSLQQQQGKQQSSVDVVTTPGKAGKKVDAQASAAAAAKTVPAPTPATAASEEAGESANAKADSGVDVDVNRAHSRLKDVALHDDDDDDDAEETPKKSAANANANVKKDETSQALNTKPRTAQAQEVATKVVDS
ncbi:hypothetical protein BAUCODRAFT_29635 [Baudoinia panamericana UAMH 10762]|uniref:Uncharacterized protein n=1 Tax=Baudoinia panamericana (strain UAMH 10762) TaxID=717646 RepID=M2M271_BAUPA|nr:uncharacterized protein BAUCODRAFT_29635 [Baudoinia panamericana UAMH 10762]EMD01193.1 hypothetical protein BAUCODRAFT_29635 [Baudoinia panamericana UAMH 10762]